MTSDRILITGGAGFIGSHLAERLLSSGADVTVIDSLSAYYDPAVKRRNILKLSDWRGFLFVEGDLLEIRLADLLADVSLVFHLAAQPGVRASWEQFALYTRANVDATQRLLQAARTSSVQRVVLASSSSVYGDAEALPTSEDARLLPVSPYGATKLVTEHLARIYWESFGLETVALRYFTVYGPRQRPDMAFNRLISAALVNKQFSVFGDGMQTRDFTFVSDAVKATIAAGATGQPGSVYNVGGGSRRSMRDVVGTLEELLGRVVNIAFAERQIGDARDTSADIRRAASDLCYQPSVGFAKGLAAQLDWHRTLVRDHDSAGLM